MSPIFINETEAVETLCQTFKMPVMRCKPAALSITVCPLGFTANGPGSTRYWIGIAAGFQVKGFPGCPNPGPPTRSGPPAKAQLDSIAMAKQMKKLLRFDI